MNADDTDDKTTPSNRYCNHHDMCGESAVETLNGGSWCTICGAQLSREGEGE